MRNIVVGVDGSGVSRLALEFAGRLGLEVGACLTVVNVRRLATAVSRSWSRAEERRAWAEAAAVLDPLGVSWQLHTSSGDPVAELDRSAGEHGADLIVIGGRGNTMGSRVLLESVSSRLVHQAHHPVLVVR